MATAHFTSTPTPVPSLIPSATATATTTASPTPTLTPSPTAVPFILSGDPYTGRLREPVPVGNAPCGLVDVLDFPIDPPHAAGISRGGQDFGLYRQRYEKIHAGEDWGGSGGRGNNFGTPVYSIGHGFVTYAEPEGWNRDKGVVIIRHIFADGSTFLSFYGHLDPPSIVLEPGVCVKRGQHVGDIGRPRSSPHLHFEIRTHMPYNPGPGYWPEDPTLVGWLPPSQTIWQQRISSSPGVQWTRPFTNRVQPLGRFTENSFALIEGDQLVTIGLDNGRLAAILPITDEVDHALINKDRSILYTANRLGQLAAYQLPEIMPLWQMDLDGRGIPLLMPLPGGGVVMSIGENLFAVADSGRLLWQQNVRGRPFSWVTGNDQLILTTNGSYHATWLVNPGHVPLRATPLTGYPLHMGQEIWLYGEEGVYRLNPARATPELLHGLPPALLLQSHIIALPDGGALVAHADRFDHRLIALNSDGSVRWQRSYRSLAAGDLQLLVLNEQVYLVTAAGSNPILNLSVYALDLATAELTHIFTGGTRTAVPGTTWAMAAGDGQMLINLGGGHMLTLDPLAAKAAVVSPSE